MKTIQEKNQLDIELFRNEITQIVHDKFIEEKEMNPIMFGIHSEIDDIEVFALEGLGVLMIPGLNKKLLLDTVEEFNDKRKPIAIALVAEGRIRTSEPLLDSEGNPIFELEELAREIDVKDVLFIKFETYNKHAIIYWEVIQKENEGVDLKLLVDTSWTDKSEDRFENDTLLNKNYTELAIEATNYLNEKFNMN